MAAKRITPLPKAVAKPTQRGAEVKAAAKAAHAEDDDQPITHMGPGSGQAGAVDPHASSASLRSSSGAAPTVEARPTPAAAQKGTAPAIEAKAAAPVAETKAAPVEAAAQALRDGAVENRLKAVASGDDDSRTLPTPRLPGQQSSDSGTASHTPGAGRGATSGGGASSGGSSGAVSSEATGSGSATSDGGRNPFGAPVTERLDAATAGALSQLDAAKPDLRGGLDVFQSTTGASTTPAGSGSSHRGQLAAAEAAGKPNPAQAGSDHAADVAGQVTGGRGSTGALLGDRMAGVQGELAIAGGLIGDQATRASGPSVAEGGSPIVARALDLAEKAADGDADAYRKLEKLADEMHKERTGAAGATGGIGYGARTNADGELVAPSGDKAPGAESPFWKSVADIFTGSKELSGKNTVRGEALQQALDDQDQLEDPGDPLEGGGMPTLAQIAFRQELRDALGGAQTGSGDIDPADNGGVTAGGSKFGGASNDNLGLVGQPNNTRTGGGTMQGPSTGRDVDPVEGSAFSGPSLGGNPEDVSFGTETLPLDSLPRSSSTSSDDDEEEDDKRDDDHI